MCIGYTFLVVYQSRFWIKGGQFQASTTIYSYISTGAHALVLVFAPLFAMVVNIRQSCAFATVSFHGDSVLECSGGLVKRWRVIELIHVY